MWGQGTMYWMEVDVGRIHLPLRGGDKMAMRPFVKNSKVLRPVVFMVLWEGVLLRQLLSMKQCCLSVLLTACCTSRVDTRQSQWQWSLVVQSVVCRHVSRWTLNSSPSACVCVCVCV